MEFGKFSSAEELLKGYCELEKSFTQKCQQVATLQKQLDGTSADAPPSTTEDDVATIPQGQTPLSNVTPTEQALQQYLLAHPDIAYKVLQQNASQAPSPTVMTGGGKVSMALPSRPRTIREATVLAKQLFGS